MNRRRFVEITRRYSGLRIAVVGDFCLDRYLEIDSRKNETSLETGLTVYNVVNVRAQAGGAGTVVNNLAALGVRGIFVVGFCGQDGEGFELQRALASLKGVRLDHFLATPQRRTFTYCKPLVLKPGRPPRELNRLDSKNWARTPAAVERQILKSLAALRGKVDAVIAVDQVTTPETGVMTAAVREALRCFPRSTTVIADSRSGLRRYPPVIFKMNAAELKELTGLRGLVGVRQVQSAARRLAEKNGCAVIVTMAGRGMVGAEVDGSTFHAPAFPLRGPIDIVGAGDAVMANLGAALAAGATLREAIELASAAASVVIHQLGTTGTATIAQVRGRLFARAKGNS